MRSAKCWTVLAVLVFSAHPSSAQDWTFNEKCLPFGGGFYFEMMWADDRGYALEHAKGIVGCDFQSYESILRPGQSPKIEYYGIMIAYGQANRSRCMSCPGDDDCGPVNTSLAGQNCCTGGQFGATYTLCTDENGCEALCCNSSACHGCGPPPAESEGASCACAEGGNGTITYEYDANGCPDGAVCDGCMECPELTGAVGDACTCSDGKNGSLQQSIGDDDCPILLCTCSSGPCNEDSNDDGIPDYLEGNPLFGKEEGDECQCSNGQDGEVVFKETPDGCPYPSCECECEAGDSDMDGCCDDEDPDPDDESVGCDNCEQQIAQKLSDLVILFRSKVGFTAQGNIEPTALSFTVDTTGAIPGVFNFPLKFGGDFTTLKFWYGHPENTQGRGLPPTVFDNLASVRSTIRGALALLILVLFWRAMLKAIFSPHR